jgi:hypothetical protein
MKSGRVLSYASGDALKSRAWKVWDVIYLMLVLGCYKLAGYAQTIMPGGYNWNYDWEYANFLMTVAAGSSIVLFIAGLVNLVVHGRQRVGVVLLGTVLSGILPVVMFFFAKRWLQDNFA